MDIAEIFPLEIWDIISSFAANTNLKFTCKSLWQQYQRTNDFRKKCMMVAINKHSLDNTPISINTQMATYDALQSYNAYREIHVNDLKLRKIMAERRFAFLRDVEDVIPMRSKFDKVHLTRFEHFIYHSINIPITNSLCRITKINIKCPVASIMTLRISINNAVVYNRDEEDVDILNTIMGSNINLPPFWNSYASICNFTIILSEPDAVSLSYCSDIIDPSVVPPLLRVRIILSEWLDSFVNLKNMVAYIIISPKHDNILHIFMIVNDRRTYLPNYAVINGNLVIDMLGFVYGNFMGNKHDGLYYVTADLVIHKYEESMLSIYYNIWESSTSKRLSYLYYI